MLAITQTVFVRQTLPVVKLPAKSIVTLELK